MVSVVDRGIGIPEEELPYIFERSFRARAAKKVAESNSLGLGLYIARLIADAHGARIWAESEVGVGSTFYLALPIS